MSEYQLYEFQTLDRALTDADLTYLKSLSSRVELTATSARFNYSYRDFRGDPVKVLERCFDMMLYQANFGIRRLVIRLPIEIATPDLYEPYCVSHLISVKTTSKSVIIDLNLVHEDYYGWLGEDSCLPGMIEIREALLRGDLRVLYLAWLQTGFAEDYALEWEEAIEPPVPPNLKKLSPALKHFVDVFEIDTDLIAAAATISETAQSPTEPIEDWIAALPEAERNQYLVRVAKGEKYVGAELMQRLRQQFGQPTATPHTETGRSFADLVAAAEHKAAERERKAQRKAEKAEQQRLEALSPKVENLWKEVWTLIGQGQAKTYDKAVAHLKDLKAIAERKDQLETFYERLQEIEQRFSRRPALISRLNKAGLKR